MKKKEEKQEEIEHVEAEDVVAVDVTKIETALVKKNITQEAITAMKEEFLTLKVNGIHDKDGYKLVDEKRKFVKKVISLTTDVCESGRAAALAEQRAWIAKEKEIKGELAPIREYLEAQLKEVDDEKKRIKEEEDRKEQLRLQQRTVKLLNLGMILVGDNYILEGHVINALHVKIYDDFMFGQIVAPVEAEAKEKARLKAIEDAKLKELQAAQAKEREEFLAKEKAQEEEKKRLEEANKKLEEEKKALAEAKIKARKTSLFALGFSQQHDLLLFKEVRIFEKDIVGMSEQEWLSLLQDTTNDVNLIKERLEKERLEKIEADKQAAVEAERKRIEAEQETKKKAEEDALAKAKKEEDEAAAEKARQEALRPDQEKYDSFIKELTEIKFPEFATPEYQDFNKYMRETVVKMVNHFNKEKATRIK